MNDKPKQPESNADLLNGAHQRLEEMFKTHFRGARKLTLLGVVLLLVTYGVIVLALRQPPNTALVSEISKSNQELARLAQAALNTVASSNAPAATDALKAVATQAELHKKAIEELQVKEKETPKEASAFLQLLGGSVILALLGYLGLQRLQSIDVEMQGLREFMFKQISERAAEQKAVMESQVRGEVAKEFSETKDELEAIKKNSEALRKADEQRFSEQAEEATTRITQVQEQVSGLLKKYAWLEDASLKSAADDLSRIVSVEQAYIRAELFSSNNQVEMARLALKQVVDRNLKGDAADFHNALTHAFDLKDPALALDVAELGLSCFPYQYDLMADKARALVSSGRRDDARALLEGWMEKKPQEFCRSWRPFTFYVDVLKSCELSEDALAQLNDVFSRITTQLPSEDKPWANYADLMSERGQIEKAEEVARKGLEHNPYSQQLYCSLGLILMRRGEAEEAVEVLEHALQLDFEDQFQPAIKQDAVLCWLAQAYEAAGNITKAEEIYGVTLQLTKRTHVEEYCKNRIIAIRVTRGDLRTGSGGGDSASAETRTQAAGHDATNSP